MKLDQIKDPQLVRRIQQALESADGLKKDIAREIPRPGKRIRQSTKPLMNKLEREFYNQLPGKDHIMVQAVRFRLANGLWYKPDFVLWAAQIAYEVKGPHAFRGGFENLKMAAATYPGIVWILVWKENGEWRNQRVLP